MECRIPHRLRRFASNAATSVLHVGVGPMLQERHRLAHADPDCLVLLPTPAAPIHPLPAGSHFWLSPLRPYAPALDLHTASLANAWPLGRLVSPAAFLYLPVFGATRCVWLCRLLWPCLQPRVLRLSCATAFFQAAAKPVSWSLVATAVVSEPLLQQAICSMPPAVTVQHPSLRDRPTAPQRRRHRNC